MSYQELIQIDTTNILFICGGAFDGLEKIIGSRIGQKSMGFGGEIEDAMKKDVGELFRQVLPKSRDTIASLRATLSTS